MHQVAVLLLSPCNMNFICESNTTKFRSSNDVSLISGFYENMLITVKVSDYMPVQRYMSVSVSSMTLAEPSRDRYFYENLKLFPPGRKTLS